MNQILKLVAFFGFIILLIHSTDVQITCANYPPCRSGLAYIYKNSTDEQFECTDSCDAFDLTVDVFDCQLDFTERQCQTGVCLAQGGQVFKCLQVNKYCNPDLSFVEVNVTCQQCQIGSCPPSNLCIQTLGIETCYLLQECTFPWLALKQENCPDEFDTMGQKCKCCDHYHSEKALGMCSSNALYDSPKLHAMSSKNLPDKDRSYENSFLDDFLNQLYQALYL